MHGGVKFYRGSAAAARSYVEADRSRVDDYYLAEGTGLATRYVATTPPAAGGRGIAAVQDGGTLDGDAYERWVAGYDVETGAPKGRLRTDERGLRFVEVVVNGPKTWSLAAALHPEIAAAYDAAQDRAATEIIGWLAEHATTRVGPRGRQVQVPVEQLEAAVVRHYTSRAGDPHRHLHLQINARVFAAGAVAGPALGRRGGQHRGDQRDRARRRGVRPRVPRRRSPPTATPSTPRPARSPSSRRTPARSAPGPRRSPATSTATRPSGAASTPGRSPARRLRRAWDRRAWATARPDKVVPDRRRRAAPTLGRGAARARLHPTQPPSAAGRAARDGDRPDQPGRGGRPGADPAGCTPVGLERRRHPRRGRTHRRRRRHRRPGTGAARAGRGPHRPHRRPLRAAAGPRRRTRARPRAHLAAGARRRGRPRHPARRTRRAARRHLDRVGHVVAGRELDQAQRAGGRRAGRRPASCW